MFRSYARPRPPKGDDAQFHGGYVALPIALWGIAVLALAASIRLDRPVGPSVEAEAPQAGIAAVIGA